MKKKLALLVFFLLVLALPTSIASASTIAVGGKAFSSSNAPGVSPDYAFDGKFLTKEDPNVGFWQSVPGVQTNGVAFIGYDFGKGNEKSVESIVVQQHPREGFSVSSVKVQNLKADGTWNDVGTYDVKMYDTTTLKLPTTEKSQAWRLLANSNVSREWAVVEVELQGPASVDPPTNPEQPPVSGERALLTITMLNGMEKEYDLSAQEVSAFINWYDAKDAGNGPAKYVFNKTWNKGPFSKRTEYVIFDKILTFEVSEYTLSK
ncbi:hypothetical protein [Paenibacillus tuaregi]|uniref:hypothetical protein n=1 Tax=Paenibacillus tuaregi TaxID=1816681 RepID=UPI000A46D2C5|nr:hypothetical protein [Paenibacillus tuaregi]